MRPDLLPHRAPDDLLDRALARRAPRPTARPRVALAAAALLGLGLGGGLLLARLGDAPDPAAALAQVSAPAATAPEAATAPAPVRLVVYAPDARSAAVAGSWNDWDPQAQPMRAVGDGLFVTNLVLEAGRYEYMFVLDGKQWVEDPTALVTRDDGFGRRNAILEI